MAFAERFGTNPPDELNGGHRLTVIANDVDPATERIVTYLNDGFGVPVNVVFFRYFGDEGREYLARTWLLDEATTPAASGDKRGGSREPWNGRDWYVSFGEEPQGRTGTRRASTGSSRLVGVLGFRTMRSLPVGARVFAHIPQVGYVGAGTVTGEATRFDDAVVMVDGHQQKLPELVPADRYHHTAADDEDTAEYVVPVAWISTRPREKAVRQKGMFANQNSACKLRNRFTLDILYSAFGLDEADARDDG